MRELVNINGRIQNRDQAVLSVFDRGFLYGDSVYETVRTYEGIPFLLDRHLKRLTASAERIALPGPSEAYISREVSRTREQAGEGEWLIRIVVTRGETPYWPEGRPVGLDPAAFQKPNLIVYLVPFLEGIPELQESGVAVSIVPIRRNSTASLDPRIKSSNQLNNILAVAAASRDSSYEAIMLNPEGFVAEGASSNLFIVRNGELMTPPLGAGILEGITREVVFQLAGELGMPFREVDFLPQDLRDAEEAFLTSSIKEIMPIVRCNGRPVGSGRPGRQSVKLLERFHEMVRTSHRSHR